MPMNPRLLRPLASGRFSPASISDLALWLDAQDASSYSESSGQITEWRDKSGNGRDFAQTTANNRPTLYTSSGNVQTATLATINGRQAFYFDGVNDVLNGNAASLNIRRNVDGFTMFFVAELETYSAAASWRGLFYVTNNIGNNGLLVEEFDAGSGWRMGARRLDTDGQSLATGSVSPLLATPMIVRPVFDYGNAEVRLHQNASEAVNMSFQAAGFTSDTDGTLAQIGNRQGQYWKGTIGSVLAYRRVLTADEISTIETYLASRWGITL